MNSREEWNSILSGCAICCWIFAQEMLQFAHSHSGLFCFCLPPGCFIRLPGFKLALNELPSLYNSGYYSIRFFWLVFVHLFGDVILRHRWLTNHRFTPLRSSAANTVDMWDIAVVRIRGKIFILYIYIPSQNFIDYHWTYCFGYHPDTAFFTAASERGFRGG